MSNAEQKIQFAPIRSVKEFVGDNQWIKPNLNPNEFGELQKQIVSNLIYYQSNYGAVLISFLLLVGFCNPTAMIFGVVIFAGLLGGFVFGAREKNVVPTFLNDRPILILLLILIVGYFVNSIFGTTSGFLFGIALPLASIIVHATIRKQTVENKATNTVESVSLRTSPMGFLLGWLGTKPTEEPSKPVARKGK